MMFLNKFFVGAIVLIAILGLWAMRPSWLFKASDEGFEEAINNYSILESVEALGKLELVKYNFKEITELSEKNKAYLGVFKVPDSKAVLITNGQAVGCIDLGKIKQEDIIIQQDSLLIKLPQPELCYYKLDLKDSKVYSVEKSVYYKDDKDLIEKVYKAAEEQIKVSALKSGILEQTANNAEIMLKPMLEQISGKKVGFVYQIDGKVTIEALN